jgi:WD40 repeat protein
LLERQKLRDWRRQQELIKQRQEDQRHEILDTFAANGSKKRELVVRDDSRKRACTNNTSESSSAEPDKKFRPWKSVYRERFKVGFNWKYGRCTIKTFKGHDNGVTCLQFNDNILVTGSYDAKIKIWDINTGEEIRTLTGHTMGIRTLKFVDNKLFSGSLDNTVKVWNWNTGECVSTLRGHTEGVISVDFDGKWLASGSIDKNIKVFNFDSKETFCLKGHDDWVNHVRLDPVSQVLFSASDDTTIKIWDLEHKTCIKVRSEPNSPLITSKFLTVDRHSRDIWVRCSRSYSCLRNSSLMRTSPRPTAAMPTRSRVYAAARHRRMCTTPRRWAPPSRTPWSRVRTRTAPRTALRSPTTHRGLSRHATSSQRGLTTLSR